MAGIKRKREVKTLQIKKEIITRLDEGEKPVVLAQEFSCNKSTISDIKKNKQKILSFIDRIEVIGHGRSAKKRKTLKTGVYDDVEKATYLWFLQERSRGTPISGPIVREKALQFYHQLHGEGSDKFKASPGWLDNFKRRHGIRQLRVVGEALSAEVDRIQPFIEMLHKKIQDGGFAVEQLYNADETGLVWRLLPSKTLVSAQEKHASGGKSQKARITLLACANATGKHKLKPVLIGKYKKPRCFKNVDMKALPVHYVSQKNAWMDTDIFESWFHVEFIPTVKHHLQSLGLPCKAILLIDNCAAHSSEDILCSDDDQIQAIFLPPNTTAVIQPLDGGILEATKRNYRKLLLQRVLTADNSLSVLQATKLVNLKDVTYMVGEAWEKVKAESIMKVWRRTLLNDFEVEPTCVSASESDVNAEPEEDAVNIMSQDLREAGFDVSENDVQEWLAIDIHEPVHAMLTDEEIVEVVCRVEDSSEAEDDEEETIDELEPDIPSHKEASMYFSKCIKWLEAQTDFDPESSQILHNLQEKAMSMQQD